MNGQEEMSAAHHENKDFSTYCSLPPMRMSPSFMDVDQDFSSRTEILKNVLVSISGMFKAPS
jgi:hypothetical protein